MVAEQSNLPKLLPIFTRQSSIKHGQITIEKDTPKMRFTALLPFLAAAATAQGPPPLSADMADEVYPICPVDYDTYCCFTIVPYSNHCRRGRCTKEYGWSCISGRGKVDSIRSCLADDVDDEGNPRLRAYCKKPGEEYFPSALSWQGASFKAIIEPSDYRHWVRPGMHKPWTPSWDEIRWEDEAQTVDGNEELRKRSTLQDSDLE